MRSDDAPVVGNHLNQARVLARKLASEVPNGLVYHVVLAELDAVERALGGTPRAAFETGRGLGILAARELDGAGGQAGELRDLLFEIRNRLRVSAGLPYHA